MRHLRRSTAALAAVCGLALGELTLSGPWAAEAPTEPAHLALTVSPTAVAAGAEARVTLRIQPKDGVKINRYPKIKLQVPAQSGLAAEASAEMGNDRPPAPDQMEKNYYKTVDPLELDVRLASDARPGKLELDAKVTYFYCVTASGFCAPARVPVKIPLTVN